MRDGAAFVAQAVRSIQAQTLTEFELLAVDDGSSDGTHAILAAFAAADSRVRVLRQPALGLVAALNRGLAESRAPLVARMDADDMARPERLARQVAALHANSAAALVGSAFQVISAEGTPRRVIQPPLAAAAVHAALDRANPIAHPTVMLRRGAALAIGGYRPAFRLAEDYDLWLRLRERHQLSNLDQVLLDYREHPGQSTVLGLEQRILSEMGALAAARRRATGHADGADGSAPVDRALLRAMGLSDQAIGDGILARALGAVKEASAAGHREAARAAVSLALHQPTLRPRTRAHLWLLRVRAGR